MIAQHVNGINAVVVTLSQLELAAMCQYLSWTDFILTKLDRNGDEETTPHVLSNSKIRVIKSLQIFNLLHQNWGAVVVQWPPIHQHVLSNINELDINVQHVFRSWNYIGLDIVGRSTVATANLVHIAFSLDVITLLREQVSAARFTSLMQTLDSRIPNRGCLTGTDEGRNLLQRMLSVLITGIDAVTTSDYASQNLYASVTSNIPLLFHIMTAKPAVSEEYCLELRKFMADMAAVRTCSPTWLTKYFNAEKVYE